MFRLRIFYAIAYFNFFSLQDDLIEREDIMKSFKFQEHN